jgi:hypothetical protein
MLQHAYLLCVDADYKWKHPLAETSSAEKSARGPERPLPVTAAIPNIRQTAETSAGGLPAKIVLGGIMTRRAFPGPHAPVNIKVILHNQFD